MANVEDIKKQAQSNTKALTVVESFNNQLKVNLNKQYKAIESLVPEHVKPARLMRIALNIVSRNPKLAEVTQESLVGAIINCGVLGVEPNLVGEAYIIPYKNWRTKNMEAQFQLGYKGMLKLIRNTGNIKTVYAHEVKEKDEFSYSYGLNKDLIHKVAQGTRGETTHYYAVYHTKDGGNDFVVMTKQEITEHALKFTMQKKGGELTGVWKDHFDSMALKTALKRLTKFMDISIEIQKAIGTDETTITTNEKNVNNNMSSEPLKAEYVAPAEQPIDAEYKEVKENNIDDILKTETVEGAEA